MENRFWIASMHLVMFMQNIHSCFWRHTFLVPGEPACCVPFYLGIQIPSRHGLHDHQSLLGLDAGTQERYDVGMAASLKNHDFLDETRLLGWSGTSHNLDGHICGAK
jgi:hypothetical protein